MTDHTLARAQDLLRVYVRAFAKLSHADLVMPDGARPDDHALMRVRRLESPALWSSLTDLASRYLVVCKALHDCAHALDAAGFDVVLYPHSPAKRRRTVPLAQTRLVTQGLQDTLGALERSFYDVDEVHGALSHLSALDGAQRDFWADVAWTQPRCRWKGCGVRPEAGRGTCRRHRADRAA